MSYKTKVFRNAIVSDIHLPMDEKLNVIFEHCKISRCNFSTGNFSEVRLVEKGLTLAQIRKELRTAK